MNRLLQLSTYGMKNIEKELTIDFANATIERGINKINNVKGIFGYNGAGKSAVITSIEIYKSIICSANYLTQNYVKDNLQKLINYKTNEFYISMIFEYNKSAVLKHSIKLVKNAIEGDYIIGEEKLELSAGRTLNDKYKLIVEKTNGEIVLGESVSANSLNYLDPKSLDYTSLLEVVVKELIDRNSKEKGEAFNISYAEHLILHYYTCITTIDVYLKEQDRHRNYRIDIKAIKQLISNIDELKKIDFESLVDVYSNDESISKNEYEQYEKKNKQLEEFIKIFKPELKEIKLIPQEDHNIYHVRKIFIYKNYNVEYEFESSGIKQLVNLFSYLYNCSRGRITFIDEIDANINAVYFEKLISYFKNYGEGQLIFTTHNLEAMKALKSQKKAIVVLGVDGQLDTWIKEGNRSPISDYISGYFPNSPMNIDDFDFISVFAGED